MYILVKWQFEYLFRSHFHTHKLFTYKLEQDLCFGLYIRRAESHSGLTHKCWLSPPNLVKLCLNFISWAVENSLFWKIWQLGRAQCMIFSPFLSFLDDSPHLIRGYPTMVLGPSIIMILHMQCNNSLCMQVMPDGYSWLSLSISCPPTINSWQQLSTSSAYFWMNLMVGLLGSLIKVVNQHLHHSIGSNNAY